MSHSQETKKRVLIVEDDPLLLRVLSESFAEQGYEISSVENGLEVMSAVKEFKPDLILLDLILPGQDGFSLLKELKSETDFKDIPVIVVSNLGNEGDVKSCKTLGAEDYFIKANVEVDQIIKRVEKVLHE